MLKISSFTLSARLENLGPATKPDYLFITAKYPPFFWVLFLCALLLNLGGCASFNPVLMDQVHFKDRSQSQETDDLIVTVSVLSQEETDQVFGMPISEQGVQPVWIKIKNKSTEAQMLLTATIDFDYFTPFEIGYPHHGSFSGDTNKAIDQFLHDQHFDWLIRPGEENSGFVYTNLEPGFKYLNLGIYSDHNYQTFQFTAEVPGLETDYSKVDFDALYGDEYIELNEQELRQALKDFQCCTTNKEGDTDGDPLNLVVIGPDRGIAYAFASRDWYVTETIHGNAVWKTIKSSVFGSQYKTSPVSPLYVFGRPQDIAMQKARSTVDERNHLRLWLTPWLFKGEHVYIGQISRDIGVKFTMKSPTISTHKVDPDVDEARNYLLQDLAFSEHLKKMGFVQGVGKTGLEENRQNLTGDPYFTDGMRMVMVVTKDMLTIEEIDRFDWELVRDHRERK
jgi:hypothetical protein